MDTISLFRSNPKLTGNIKISVDSSGGIYLNSFDANSVLSDSKYKKVRVNPNGKYAIDMCRFFDMGGVPNNIIFDIGRSTDDISSKKEFDKHFETQYNYGLSRCNSSLYDEQFSFLAPIWLTKKIPKYFVIFKNPGAKDIEYTHNPTLEAGRTYRVVGDSSFTTKYGTTVYTNGQNFTASVAEGLSYINTGNGYIVLDDPAYEENFTNPDTNLLADFIADSDIVTVFDLSENSSIGKYLRNHINDSLYSEDILTVSFEENILAYKGINIADGVTSTASENLDQIIENEIDLIDFEEYITLGYERHGMVINNLLNIEFLFDDNTSDPYTFNRYFGFYCDDIDMGKFLIDREKMFDKSDGLYHNPYYKLDNIPSFYSGIIADADGIKIIPEEIFSSEGHIIRKDKINETNSFYYFKDKYGAFLKINNIKTDDYYVIEKKSLDSASLFGFSNNHIEVTAIHPKVAGKSSLMLTVNSEFTTGYRMEFFYNKSYIGCIIADHLPNLTLAELALIPNDFSGELGQPYGPGTSVGFFFYPYGTKEEIAKAITGAIDYLLRDRNIDSINVGEQIIVMSRSYGYDFDKFTINEVFENGELSYERDGFGGGTIAKKSRIVVDKDLPVSVTSESYLLTTSGFSRISSISPYLDEPIYGVGNKITGFNNIDKFKVINIIDDRQEIKLVSGIASIYNQEKLRIGVFSLYDIKDFDFDFYKSVYSKSYVNEYKKYYNTDPDKLVIGEDYTIYKLDSDPITAEITHDGITYSVTSTPVSFTATVESYSVITGSPIVINQKYYGDEELQKFIGFKTMNIQLSSNINVSTIDPDDLKNKFSLLSYNQTLTEYDRLKEVEKSKNILKSKIVPYINKWVFRDGKNIRDVDYRLNVSPVFGELNFSPSFADDIQNSAYFTHEWPYLAALPENIANSDLLSSTSYFSKIFSVDKLKDTKRDYFSEYFTVDSQFIKASATTYDMIDVPTQQRYSVIKKTSDGNYETFFRGVKVRFASIRDYEGYKFATILNFSKTKYLEAEEPFKVTVIENRDFKNITFKIDIVVDDYKVVPDLTLPVHGEYLFLYVMNSLRRWDAGYLYGIEFNYPDLISIDLLNSIAGDGNPPLDPTPITKFRGYQLFNKVDMNLVLASVDLPFKNDIFYLNDLFKVTHDGIFDRLVGIDKNKAMFLTSTNVLHTSTQYIIDKPNTINTVGSPTENIVKLLTSGMAVVNIPSLLAVGSYDPIDVHTNLYDLSKITWFHQNGGLDVYAKIAQLLSFASLSDMVSFGSPHITYQTIIGGVVNNGNDYTMSFAKPSLITRDSYLSPLSVNLSFPELPAQNIIDYEEETITSDLSFFRYGGVYVPKFRDVLHFKNDKLTMAWGLNDNSWDNSFHTWYDYRTGTIEVQWDDFDDTWTTVDGSFTWVSADIDLNNINQNTIPQSDKLSGLKTKLDSTISNFGIMENVFYHKVDPDVSNLLSLTNPIYPSVDELAIDKMDVNIFKSDFDANYYRRYLDKSTFSTVYGSMSQLDSKSYLASKAVNVEKMIILGTYRDVIQDVNVDDLQYNMLENEIAYQIVGDVVTFRISLKTMLIEYFFDSIEAEYKKYVNEFNTIEGNFDDAIRNYVNTNIISLYRILQITPYVFKSGQPTNQDFIKNESNDLVLLSLGYKQDKNFTTQNVNDLEVIMKYKMDTGMNYSFAFRTELSI